MFRIDHYLGKPSVQNLFAMRFGNALFEPLWRREHIASIQITLAEELGVEKRGAFYDHTGALRDMVQNHALQLVCAIAMEPPINARADAIRDEIASAEVEAVIPSKSNRRKPIPHDKAKYKWRNQIERLFNKLKNWRRVATRYDKTVLSFESFLNLAAARLWLKSFVNAA